MESTTARQEAGSFQDSIGLEKLLWKFQRLQVCLGERSVCDSLCLCFRMEQSSGGELYILWSLQLQDVGRQLVRACVPYGSDKRRLFDSIAMGSCLAFYFKGSGPCESTTLQCSEVDSFEVIAEGKGPFEPWTLTGFVTSQSLFRWGGCSFDEVAWQPCCGILLAAPPSPCGTWDQSNNSSWLLVATLMEARNFL